MSLLKQYVKKVEELNNIKDLEYDWLGDCRLEIIPGQLKEIYEQMDYRDRVIVDIINKSYEVKL